MSSESDSESIMSDDNEEDQKKRQVQKELHRIDNLKKEQDEFMSKLSCEKPVRIPSLSREEIKQNSNEEQLTQLFQEVEEEMDQLIAKAKQYVQFLYKTQGEENKSLPNTYLKVQPSILKKGKLTQYQLQGLNWLISMQEAGLNGILADQMGLGKTIQTIALIGFMNQFKNILGPHLIVGPLSTVPNWVREFSEWLPKCRVIQMLATEEWRQEHGKMLNQNHFDVIVTSYESVLNNDRILKRFKYQYLIIDEAHKLKNEESLFVCSLKKLNSRFKLLLTGTPIQNNPHELWSLLNYLMPSLFASSEMFDQWFQINKIISEKQLFKEKFEQKNLIITQKAKSIIQAFMLRRTKSEVALEIPPKKEIHLYVQMTPVQKAHYKTLILNKKVIGQTSQKSIQNILMQLRKICLHLYMFPELEDPDLPTLGEHLIEGSGKFKVLDMFLKKLYNEKHKVILFSQFTSLLDILEDYLNYREYKFCRIDGNSPIEERDQNIKDFQKPDSDIFIFLLSTRAGGLGITLTAADTVIIYDSDFNPQLDQQAMDRAHRIGQKKQVMVYRLICKSTVEEKIIERQQIKLRWEQMVVDGGHSSMVGMMNSKEDLKSLTSYGASQILKDEPYTEEDIETLLKRGEELTEQLNKEIDKKFKVIKETIDKVDLGVKSIKILDFFKDPSNNQDLHSIEQELKLQSNIKQPEQTSKKNQVLPLFSRLCTEIEIEPYKFYSDPELLKQLMQREKDFDLYEDFKKKDIEFELDKEIIELTSMEKKQLTKIKQTGFEWSKREFEQFIQSCIKFGRKDVTNIANSMNFPKKEVENYIEIFNYRYQEIPGYEKIMDKIQRSETLIEQEIESTKLLADYIKYFQNPLLEMDFQYNYKLTQQFTKIHDQLFIYATYIIGYGKWDKIREFVFNHEYSFFDDFLRTINSKTIKSRVLILLKYIKTYVQQKEKQAKRKSRQEEQKQQDSNEESKNQQNQQNMNPSKSRSNSRNKKKKKSKSVKKPSESKKPKSHSSKSSKPISNVKSHSLDQALKKQILKK